MLIAAALLIILVGMAHSLLGERYILMRLFRQPLPELFGSDWFTRQTLRFAWHITTVTWFGIAALFMLLHIEAATPKNILSVLGVTFAISGLTALVASKGKHLSWIAFALVATICFARSTGAV